MACALLIYGLTPPAAAAQSCGTVKRCIAQLHYGETRKAREIAARVLGERGNSGALAPLAKALKEDGGEFVRANSAEALGRLGVPGSVKPLATAIREDRRE